MRKKALSWILTVAMVCSLFTVVPIKAHASDYQCQIVETATYYDTFNQALSAVADEETIKLLKDVTYESTIAAYTNSFTLDVNGHSLSVVAAGTCIHAEGGSDIYIKDGSVGGSVNLSTSDHYAVIGLSSIGNGSTIDIDVPTSINIIGDYSYGVFANNGGKVSVTGDINVTGTSSYGAFADGTTVGSLITIDGEINSINYVHVHMDSFTGPEQSITPTTKEGYYTFFDNDDTASPKSTVWVKEAAAPMIAGQSVWRNSAATATVRFMSDTAGTLYYQVTDSEMPPATGDLSEWTNDGAVLADTKVEVSLTGMTSGAKYVHIVVKDDLNNISNVMTSAMPYDLYYFDDFESYSAVSGEYPANFFIKYNGAGTGEQKVISTVQTDTSTGNVFRLKGTSSWASDQRVTLPSGITGVVVLEYDAKAVTGNGGDARFGQNSVTWTGSIARVEMNSGIFRSIIGDSTVTASTMTYELGTWYHVKIELDYTNRTFNYYVEGEKVNSVPLSAQATYTLDYFGLGAGNSSSGDEMYYDNLEVYADPAFSGGSGTPGDPYRISTEEDLFELSEMAADGNTFVGKYFEQTDDISLTQTWVPIKDFNGIYTGNLNTVSNLTFNSHIDNVGFFANTGSSAQLEDIVLNDVTFTNAYLYAGSLVGYSDGSTISGCSAQNVYITGDSYVGGLVGYGYPTVINNCHVDGELEGGYYTGGLAGYSEGGSITNSNSAVEIIGNNDAGGLVGYNYNCQISNSYATGSVEGNYRVGGLVGYNDYYVTITNCYATGNVIGLSSNTDYLGGLIGYNDRYCTVTKCYSTGNVTGDDGVGGLAGYNSSTGSTISQCYTIGIVTGNEYAYPLVGYSYGTLSKCYYLDKTYEDESLLALTPDEMALQASFIDWDYASTWQIGIDGAYDYPTLGLGGAIRSFSRVGGSISPDGLVLVLPGDEQAYSIEPDSGYSIADVIVDGESVGTVTSYTFTSVQTSHEISVSFELQASTDAGLTGVLSKTISTGSEAGTAYDPKTASINIDNSISAVALSDITAAADAAITFYGTDITFTNVETGSVLLTAGSDTTVYIKVTAEDGETALYYAVTISLFGGGDGSTPEMAYEISTANQLRHLAYNVNAGEPYSGKYFLLTADIDLSGSDWEPIGTEAVPFSGSFDGDGHVIEGLNISGEDYQYAGLFGYADSATFKNLTVGGTVANTYSGGDCYAGGVVAYAKNTQFENCNNEADVSVTSSSTENIYGYAGGIVGYLNADSETDDVALVITGCNNEGTVAASTTQTSSSAYSYNYAGGIVGCFNSYFDAGAISLSITQCTNSGSIEATAEAVETYAQGRTYAGGIIADADLGGDLDGTLTITDCLNTGAVSTDTDAYYSRSAAGGIAAELIVNKDYADAVMTIEACRNSAAVTLDVVSGTGTYSWAQGYAGGIAGYAYTSADYDSTLTISNCINDATTLTLSAVGYGSARSYLGGIVGSADAYSYESSESAVGTLIIKGSVNMAQITATAEQGNTGASMHNTGCIAGGVAGYTSDIATIISCYNRGSIAALGNSNYYAGGIEGYASEIGNISSCYSTGEIASSGNSEENTGGVVGYLYDGAVSDCYWLTGTASAAVGTDSVTEADASCTEKTVAELQSNALVTVLNAAADAGETLYGISDMPTWEQSPNLATNDGYPILSWIETPEEPSTGGGGGGSSAPTGQQVTVSTPDGGTVVTGTLTESGNTEEITISGTQFRTLVDANQGAMIPAPSAAVTFDAKAINAINGASSTGDVVLTIEKLDQSTLTPEQQKRVGDRPVYDFTLTKGGQQISSFDGGHAKISIPYTLAAGENPHQVVIYYLTSDGTLKPVRGHYDANSKCVIFETTHFSAYAVGYNPISFNDVAAGAWYKDAIDFIAAREITSGTSVGEFSPEATLTRGQFIVLLMNAYGISPDAVEEGTANFVDAGNTYYTNYLLAAKSLGIVNGIGNNMFAPEQAVTRQEMFVMLYNALEVIGELPQASGDKQLSDFGDANQVASWAQEAMNALIKGGVISGSNGMLTPTASTTRAQMAQMLYNLLSK